MELAFIALLAVVPCDAQASQMAKANCPNGKCQGPVRSIVAPAAAKAAQPVRKVAAAVAAKCGRAGCDCTDCPGALCNCDLRPIQQQACSPKPRKSAHNRVWHRTRLLPRIRFAPQRRWR